MEAKQIKLYFNVKVFADCYKHLFDQLPAKHGKTTDHAVGIS